MAQRGILLPRTAFTYLNLGPIRQTGLELWLEQQVSRSLAASVNYSGSAGDGTEYPHPRTRNLGATQDGGGARRGERMGMFGPYIHQIDPVLFDIAGVHVWWYGLG